jgi:hypothetical protein
MGTSLLHLPTELLHEISQSCAFFSLKQLRQCCKTLAACVTPFIFHHVHITLLDASLVKLERISQDFNLRTHVKKLTFSTNELPNYHLFKYIGSQRRLDRSGLETLWETESGSLWCQYQKYRQSQQGWHPILSTRKVIRFTTAYAKLENLKCIKVQQSCIGDICPSIRSELQRDAALQPTDREYEWHGQGAKQLYAVLEAVRVVQPEQLKSFRFDIIGSEFFVPCPKDKIRHPMYLDAKFGRQLPRTISFKGVFKQVHNLTIGMDFLVGSAVVKHAKTVVMGLIVLLQDAKSLRFLRLCFNDAVISNCDFFEGLRITRTTFPNLRHLLIQSLHTTEENLMCFLEQHSSTLKKLALSDISLLAKGGTWDSVWQKIPQTLILDTITACRLVHFDQIRRKKQMLFLASAEFLARNKIAFNYALYGNDGRDFPYLYRVDPTG